MQSDPWFLVNKVLSLYYFDEIRRLRIRVKGVLLHEQLPAFPSVNFSDALAGCQEPCCWRGCCCSHGQRCKCVAAQSLYFRDVRMEPASCREVTDLWGLLGERLASWAHKCLRLAASDYCPRMQDTPLFPRKFRNSNYSKSPSFKREGKELENFFNV